MADSEDKLVITATYVVSERSWPRLELKLRHAAEDSGARFRGAIAKPLVANPAAEAAAPPAS